MYKVTNPEKFREHISDKLFEIINNRNIVSNLEKGLYNYSLDAATKKKIVKKWENQYFVQIYLDRVKSIFINLTNESLLNKIVEKKIKAHELAFMTHQEMNEERWKALIELQQIKEENKYAPKIEASTDDFTCFKCKSKECTHYQLQTRSADEPMTTFVTCIRCSNRWKC
jgi:transcription elongation factor S-II